MRSKIDTNLYAFIMYKFKIGFVRRSPKNVRFFVLDDVSAYVSPHSNNISNEKPF